MDARVKRLFVRDGAQFGALSFDGEEPLCFTLEDVTRAGPKIPGETCIRGGRYELKLRTFGRLYQQYRVRHPWNEPGMLWLQGVPQFSDVLIHCGSTKKHTAGCVLLGDRAEIHRPMLSGSLDAYQRFYKRITPALLSGERCWLEVKEIGEA